MTEKDLLLQMLHMHDAKESLTVDFINTHSDALEALWEKGLSTYRITKMQSGKARGRRIYNGVLTPQGEKIARDLS